jgi:hypothetical protein
MGPRRQVPGCGEGPLDAGLAVRLVEGAPALTRSLERSYMKPSSNENPLSPREARR